MVKLKRVEAQKFLAKVSDFSEKYKTNYDNTKKARNKLIEEKANKEISQKESKEKSKTIEEEIVENVSK
uniref:Phage protein n=1 Tax=Meloidogyne hapla TaxID=6305 RepID=A0A1I8BKH9_MELHA